MKNFHEIDQAIKAVCPIQGISYGRLNDKSTWIIAYAEGATDQERQAADALLQTLDVVEIDTPPDKLLQRIAALEEKTGITPIGVLDK